MSDNDFTSCLGLRSLTLFGCIASLSPPLHCLISSYIKQCIFKDWAIKLKTHYKINLSTHAYVNNSCSLCSTTISMLNHSYVVIARPLRFIFLVPESSHKHTRLQLRTPMPSHALWFFVWFCNNVPIDVTSVLPAQHMLTVLTNRMPKSSITFHSSQKRYLVNFYMLFYSRSAMLSVDECMNRLYVDCGIPLKHGYVRLYTYSNHTIMTKCGQQ